MGRAARALRNLIAPVLMCLVCSSTCLGQSDSWAQVRIIQPGRNVYVRLQTGKAIKGRMDAWHPDGLSLRGHGKVVSIDRSEIAQVALLIGKSRARKALYAGLIAGSAGATLMGLAYQSYGCCGPSTAAVAAGAGAFTGGVAAGIASLFPRHHEVIYSAPPPAGVPSP